MRDRFGLGGQRDLPFAHPRLPPVPKRFGLGPRRDREDNKSLAIIGGVTSTETFAPARFLNPSGARVGDLMLCFLISGAAPSPLADGGSGIPFASSGIISASIGLFFAHKRLTVDDVQRGYLENISGSKTGTFAVLVRNGEVGTAAAKLNGSTTSHLLPNVNLARPGMVIVATVFQGTPPAPTMTTELELLDSRLIDASSIRRTAVFVDRRAPAGAYTTGSVVAESATAGVHFVVPILGDQL